MSLQEHGEKILQDLGLTYSQARLYVSLARFGGCATANALSAFANVARQDVYRLLNELQCICLVEKVVATPAKFKAVPTKEAISILMKKRNEKTRCLVRASEELVSQFSEKNTSFTVQDDDQFILVPKGEAVFHRVENALESANDRIIVITPWREFTQWIFSLNDLWRRAVERGVKVRWITENVPRNLTSKMEGITEFLVKPNFKLKTLPQTPNKRIGVYDNKEALIATVKNQNATESPALWTNNHMMIYLLEDFFEMKWKLAKEYEKHDINNLGKDFALEQTEQTQKKNTN